MSSKVSVGGTPLRIGKLHLVIEGKEFFSTPTKDGRERYLYRERKSARFRRITADEVAKVLPPMIRAKLKSLEKERERLLKILRMVEGYGEFEF